MFGDPRQDANIARNHHFPVVVAEKAPIPQQQSILGHVAEQRGDDRLLTGGDRLGNERRFDMCAQLDEADLADLGKRPIASFATGGTPKGRLVGRPVGQVQYDGVDAHQTHPLVKSTGRLRRRQETYGLVEQSTHGSHTQSLPRMAETRAAWRAFSGTRKPGSLENLANRNMGEDSHRLHHPQDDLVRQLASTRIDPPSLQQHLPNRLGINNLFQSSQPITNPPRNVGRKRATSLSHLRASLLAVEWFNHHKLSGGFDFRLFQRY